MSHSSIMLIHEYDEESIMAKRSFDADDDDDAEIEFQIQATLKDLEEEYKKADKKEYTTLEEYIISWHGYEVNEDDKTQYGYYSNNLGMYDWYEVGGRWSNLLPIENKEKIKKLYEDTLNMKNKKGIELFRDDVVLFLKVSEMPFIEACAFMSIGGCNSITISKEISTEEILKRFRIIYKIKDVNVDIINQVITDRIILEEDGVETDLLNTTEDFVKTYNRLLKRNAKEGRDFRVTILDLHS